jgi:drug/metabolite transporter (DMT)-like permease
LSKSKLACLGIWGLAFGYFICYWPYSALTKALSSGLLTGMPRGISSFELLPLTSLGALSGMIFFLTFKGWWKYAGRKKILGIEIPFPGKWTFYSGVCSSLIIVTTTLAYTFSGVSIVFIMLLLRGGVLIIAPVVDFFSKRKVRWYSWAGLALSLLSLVVAFSEAGGYTITLACAINVFIYLMSYFVRLRIMTRFAKSDDENSNTRYFVEEQLTASPLMVIGLCVLAAIDYGPGMHQIKSGFTAIFSTGFAWHTFLLGLLSSGTGFFGGLILLDKSENTYCVPVNRSSSILAGVFASYTLTFMFGHKPPSVYNLIGAGLIILAIVFLTLPLLFKKKEEKPPAVTEPAATEPAPAEPEDSDKR